MQAKKLLILTTAVQKQKVQRINANKPEIRHQNILTNAPDYCKVIFVQQKLTTQKLKDLQAHENRMIDYLQNCYESFSKNPDSNFSFLQAGVVPYTFIQDTPKSQILKRLDYWKQAGLWSKDVLTPIFEHTWKSVLESANNCYIVPQYLNQNDQVIYCLNTHPGHHSSSNKYAGFCFLNNGAICAKALQKSGFKNIAILDIDYHAGDGSEKIFINDQSVITVSIHADPLHDYPHYSNFESQTSSSKNIIIGPDTDGGKYLQLVSIAMEYINKHNYDALIIPFGGDTYYKDPIALQKCRCGLKFGDYIKIGQFIRKNSNQKPIIVTQEGGYDMNDIHDIVHSFLSGLIR